MTQADERDFILPEIKIEFSIPPDKQPKFWKKMPPEFYKISEIMTILDVKYA